MRPSEKSAVRGSPVQNMEALVLEQSEPHFNLQTTGNNSTSNNTITGLSSFSPTLISSPAQLILEQRNNNDYNLQDLQDPFGVSSSATTSSNTNDNDNNQTCPPRSSSPPPPLTSMDIAALRKSLSSRPKLRRVCHICGRECPSRHKLQRHLSTHSEDRPYNCKVCGKAFKWTEYLSKHMRTQHGSGNGNGGSNIVRLINRSTGSMGSTSSIEDTAAPRNNTPPALTPISSPGAHRTVTPQRATVASSSNNNSNNNAASKSIAVFNSESSTNSNNTTSQQLGNTTTIATTNSGYSGNQSQSTPDVFSPQPSYDGNLLSESVPSSTPLLSNQLTPAYSGGGGGYFPQPHHGFSYPPLFPMNCYGYPAMDPTGSMGQYGMPAMHPAFNHMFPFDATGIAYQSYAAPQPQPMSSTTTQGFMEKNHSSLPSSSSTVSTTVFHSEVKDSTSNSSSVSCQTQEQQEPVPETSSIGIGPSKKPSVVIINMCTKKEVGIQCEVGDETLQALFEEESQALSSFNGFDSNSSMDTSDEGPSAICKYPCEFNGCVRSYIHRKDLIRHMKSAHGSLPKVLQPRVIETPAKPHVCHFGDCGKSYFHMKDLRRHQRHCHLGRSITSDVTPLPSNSPAETSDDNATVLRFPCDFNGCTKSYIHKKDLIRHKRTFHQDNSSHPSIPTPVVVVNANNKKGHLMNSVAMEKEKGNMGSESSENTSSNDERTNNKRFRLDSSAEPPSIAQLPVGSHQPSSLCGSGDLAGLSASDLIDNISNISAAVANILEMDKSPTSTGFPIDSLTASSSAGGSSTPQLNLIASATDKLDAAMSLADSNIYVTPTTSPSSAMFMTLLSQNI